MKDFRDPRAMMQEPRKKGSYKAKVMHNFKNLNVWVKARTFAKDIYESTKNFPEDEKYGLTSQIRRSAISISSNIAEGSGRNTDKEFLQFLKIARGSSFEAESIMILSNDFEYITNQEFKRLNGGLIEIQKMLYGLIESLQPK